MITDISLENENTILRNQVSFLMECIKNQMANYINKEHLKPYYEKIYKCNMLL